MPPEARDATATGATTCMEAPPFPTQPPTEAEVAALRAERTLLAELLAAPPAALARYTGQAMLEQRQLRLLLARRTRDPEAFRRKLRALRRSCARLARRGLAVPVPQIAQRFEAAAHAFGQLAEARSPGGDEFLPALELLEAALFDLTLVALRTGTQPPTRRRARRAQVRHASRGNTGTHGPQLGLALEQLAGKLAGELGKRVELTLIGLEEVPLDLSGAVFDICSQLLRNAVQHGIELPARRTASGKPAAGQVLVEFRVRESGRGELLVQDDGQGMDPDQLTQANARGAERGRGLSIVGQRVRGLRGQLQMASRRGQNTRVRVRLPMPRSSAATAA